MLHALKDCASVPIILDVINNSSSGVYTIVRLKGDRVHRTRRVRFVPTAVYAAVSQEVSETITDPVGCDSQQGNNTQRHQTTKRILQSTNAETGAG